MRTMKSGNLRLKADSRYAPIVSRAVGTVDFLVAAAAAFFVTELMIRFSSFERMSSEIGVFPLIAYLLLFLSFGWAGFSLFRRPNAWQIQIVPIVATFAFIMFFGIYVASIVSA